MAFFRAAFFILFLCLPGTVLAEARLLMAEEDGCVWCARWNAEVGDAYGMSPEGRAAPLVRFDMHNSPPDSVKLKSRVRFSPTFILVQDGQEIDRIEGYPGEDFFWGLLGMMLDRASITYDKTG